MSGEPLLEAEGLSKIYPPRDNPFLYIGSLLSGCYFGRGNKALDNVSISLQRGECLGIVGRNGAGKSTLLQLLVGTHEPNHGRIVRRGRIAAMLSLGAGFDPKFTGRENVRLAATVYGLSEQVITERFDAITAFADIGAFIDRPVHEYSSGMYARLAFAVCAHVDADVLIVDEVLAVGDAIFQAKCRRFFESFLERGSVVFVSHDESAVLQVCNRAIWLDAGRKMAEGEPGDVLALYNRSTLEQDQTQGALPAATAEPSFCYDDPFRRRNPVSVSAFRPDAILHGSGGGSIDDVYFEDDAGHRLDTVQGGEIVRLHISGRAETELARPILGFVLRDAAGRNLFGDNTYMDYRERPVSMTPGQRYHARLTFRLPYLALGRHTLSVSIIDGTQANHYHVAWMEEAVDLIVDQSPVSFGSLAVPLHVERPRIVERCESEA